jgi:hypothetical protein
MTLADCSGSDGERFMRKPAKAIAPVAPSRPERQIGDIQVGCQFRDQRTTPGTGVFG